MAIKAITRFIQHEAFAGLLLMATALLALLLDNSPWHAPFNALLHQQLWHQTVSHWINHGLMTLFFISVGLEIKRELRVGELNSLKKAALPCFAALGGMLVPIIVFFALNYSTHQHWRGWAIPIATDIAFSLGIMSLLGKRCPLALKVFLMALATFDDLGAIAVIALFYSAQLNTLMLGLTVLSIALLWLCNTYKITHLSIYLTIGAILWFLIGKSGIDPAISGIVIAFSIPLKVKSHNPAARLEKKLHPWIAYAVLPLFALANAGIHFASLNATHLESRLTLGILFGLLLGKPLGVFFFSKCAVKLRLADLPSTVNWSQLTGVGFLCGVGFTMSLLIGELAFNNGHFSNEYRLAVLLASISAGTIGFFWLKRHSQ